MQAFCGINHRWILPYDNTTLKCALAVNKRQLLGLQGRCFPLPLFSKCFLLGEFEFGSDIACEIDCAITFVNYGHSRGINAGCETGSKDNEGEKGGKEDKDNDEPKDVGTTVDTETIDSTVNPKDFEVEQVETESP